jgi:hypothetical protein
MNADRRCGYGEPGEGESAMAQKGMRWMYDEADEGAYRPVWLGIVDSFFPRSPKEVPNNDQK